LLIDFQTKHPVFANYKNRALQCPAVNWQPKALASNASGLKQHQAEDNTR
jgi:hypothetical protein